MTLEQRLTEEKEHREWIQRLRRENGALTRELVREAAAEGWPKTRIAEAAGISRQTVHEMLRNSQEERNRALRQQEDIDAHGSGPGGAS